MKLNKDDFYKCFSGKQKTFLVKVKGISNILKAKDLVTDKTFWLFYKDERLAEGLKEWTERRKNGVRTIE